MVLEALGNYHRQKKPLWKAFSLKIVKNDNWTISQCGQYYTPPPTLSEKRTEMKKRFLYSQNLIVPFGLHL